MNGFFPMRVSFRLFKRYLVSSNKIGYKEFRVLGKNGKRNFSLCAMAHPELCHRPDRSEKKSTEVEMKKWIWLPVVLSLLWGQEKLFKRIEVEEENGQEKKTEVKVTIDDENAQVEVTRDGKTETLEFPLDEKDEPAIQKKLAELGVDLDDLGLGDEDQDQWLKKFSWTPEPRPFLGVQPQELTDQLRSYFGLDADGGVLIAEVIPDSPAEDAKLKAGDIILKIDDTRISDVDELMEVIADRDPGETVSIEYVRNGKTKHTKATLEEKEPEEMTWFGKGFKMPPLPQWKSPPFMFFPEDDQEDLKAEIESLKDELERMQQQLDSLRE
ncbi:MAG: PDZ domain-containing protein [Candidatus Neomarinimicrobiota bacterium]|nr:MAG: PDZ domain-containing protein [Candidatus Neomarinimicrobiota bacterium]